MSKTVVQTYEHIQLVQQNLNQVVKLLLDRAIAHDRSKLASPEKEGYEAAVDLHNIKYGTKEYYDCLEELKPTIEHHYKNNSHHPEHYPNGIDGMNLLDLIEMFCDWSAATKRMKDGDIYRSIELNQTRFHMTSQLTNILRNTANLLT